MLSYYLCEYCLLSVNCGCKSSVFEKKNKNFSVKIRLDLCNFKKRTNFAPHFAKIFGTTKKLR